MEDLRALMDDRERALNDSGRRVYRGFFEVPRDLPPGSCWLEVRYLVPVGDITSKGEEV